MKRELRSQFVESWATLSGLLGVSPSVARIHAYLMASDEAVSFDQIVEALGVSRGNASMSLKELRSWGVVRRQRQPGDRRDFYVSGDDVWQMFFAILSHRKLREFDPVVQELLGILPEAGKRKAGAQAQEGPAGKRIQQTRSLLLTTDKVMKRLLSHEKQSRLLMGLLAGFGSEP